MKEKSPHILLRLYVSWLIFIFFFTETLSYLHQITRQNIVLGNLIFFSLFLYVRRNELKKIKFPSIFKNKFSLIIFSILALTFIQGLFSAPSTTDAMTYQINRIMYWIQEKTTYQFFIRNSHDFMPPFASYILMHLYFIFNGDRFLFLSQWLAYVGSIYLSAVISLQLGANRRLSQVISLLVSTIPIAVLQATSTQADMVSAFITLLIFYLTLTFLKRPNYKYALILGLTLGLGMLVKAPFYIFVIIPLSLFFVLLRKNPAKTFVLGSLVILIALTMQLRYYSQNTKLFGNPLGQKFQGKGNTYVNEKFDLPSIVSNLVKNTMNNIPIPFFTNQAQSVLVVFHHLISIDIQDPKISYTGLDFKVAPVLYPQEDLVASPLHIILIILAGFFVIRASFKHEEKTELRLLYIFLVIAYVIFATILKYESVHNRLLVTFIVVGTTVSGLILGMNKLGKSVMNIFLMVSVPLAFLLVLLNVSRPYISYGFFYDKIKKYATPFSDIPESFFTEPRTKQYFNSRPYWYEPYDKVTDLIAKEGKNQIITMKLMDDEFEYPLWVMLKQKGVRFYVWQNKFIKREPLADSLLLTTSQKQFQKAGWQTKCFKTDVDYGFTCLSKRGAF